ncbi:hypothetical protein Trydic_g2179 [Trypoxylus dichotomus]
MEFLGFMPNIGCPKASKGRTLKVLKKLRRMQQTMCIRVSSAYNSISSKAADVIADVPPIELIAITARSSEGMAPKPDSMDGGLAKLIPDIQSWLGRSFGERLFPDADAFRLWVLQEVSAGTGKN